jgi:twitching motility two-component system response regulator PilH
VKILVVEPDTYYHSQFLERLGHLGELLISDTAGEAIENFQQFTPDAVVLELVLARGTGYDVLKHINKLPGPRQVPIIVFSANEHLEDIEASLNYGANAYFVKGKDNLDDIRSLLLTYNNS